MSQDFASQVAAVAAPGRRVTTPCGDGSMVWHVFGDENKPPLALLHGGFGSWTHWIRNVLPLSEHFHVMAADTPGLGDSDEPRLPTSMDAIAGIISDGIDALAGGRVPHICGFSFGSVLGALATAQRGPGRTASYTMVGSGNRGLSLTRGPMDPLIKLQRGMSPDEIAATHKENLARLMFADRANIDDLAVWMQTENVRRARTRSRRLEGDGNQRDAILQIDCPLNAIWGEKDATTAPHWDERRDLLAKIHPDVELHLIPDAGHWVAYEGAARLNPLLVDLLKGVASRPGRA
jgi:2-hydroxy-6-oxonona-2,4-dienedioate hydrolase